MPATKKPSSAKKRAAAPRKPAGKSAGRKSAANAKSPEELLRSKEIIGIIFIAAALVLLTGCLIAPEPEAADTGVIGVVSLGLLIALRFLAGNGAIALPLFLLAFGVLICLDRHNSGPKRRFAGLIICFFTLLALLHIGQQPAGFLDYMGAAAGGEGGGVIGALISFILYKTVGKVGAIIFLAALAVIGLLLALQTTLGRIFSTTGGAVKKVSDTIAQSGKVQPEQAELPPIIGIGADKTAATPIEVRYVPEKKDAPIIGVSESAAAPAPVAIAEPPHNEFVRVYLPNISDSAEDKTAAAKAALAAEAESAARAARAAAAAKRRQNAAARSDQPQPAEPALTQTAEGEYQLPPPELIAPGVNVKNPRLNKAITDNIGVLEQTLESFGVKATVTQVVAGPAVTRYELQPAPGVKVSRITNLADDIALSLAAQGVRIEAPIPGKSAIGIEVARKETDTVFFREMIDSQEFRNSAGKLSFALGKNIGGSYVIGDLVKMPHLLIAGATGSGKSICINSIICSILYKAKPDEVKLLLIDPKKVEMTYYATLPHLVAPVVNDSKKAANALKWAVNEMENRYTLFAAGGVKDFEGYNNAQPESKLPQIVVVIDELSDLMLVARHDVEDSICRLTQMARAAGIHLVVATQRPSVDVITGLIKANIPSRIAFAVSSFMDSRTILDMGGAEKLLGKGDMLYAPIGVNKPMRIQGTYIAEADVEKLVAYCAAQAAPAFSQTAVAAAAGATNGVGGGRDEELDELFHDAAQLIIVSGQASTSYLQRRLAIGNPRAARLIDALESKGVVGGPNGSKPREVLMTIEEFEEMYG
ncbi:MAG: DNA translocase FtsK 4TM domain-containing protein [Bacillota bacterium]|nr:DNA translocase FtsK 4TM domain-containing protein [Bacillota bacterium]